MRTFVAIELSEDIKSALDQVESHLKYSGADVKWVAKENIHLTLKFLGEIDEAKCEKVKSILDTIAKSTKPFEISLKDIGAFPNIDHPKVIWVGLDKGAVESIELAGKIDSELAKIGFEKETRPFTAHLTIGRVRSPKNKQAMKEKITGYQLPAASTPHFSAGTLTLFQSKLTPSGSIYTKLHEAKLA
ncbi:MAG: RNA 2',3'-cyclic phosphodiesterase [Candidatus Omnitrophica bacterium]|nr:RNA 2',3'-cyclic phosphodiesterase [Candidatus Omnitrophota bacterium]